MNSYKSKSLQDVCVGGCGCGGGGTQTIAESVLALSACLRTMQYCDGLTSRTPGITHPILQQQKIVSKTSMRHAKQDDLVHATWRNAHYLTTDAGCYVGDISYPFQGLSIKF